MQNPGVNSIEYIKDDQHWSYSTNWGFIHYGTLPLEP
jgi:hypothetical protein